MCGAMEEVDFPPASFEAVLSSLALHYVEELGPVFRKGVGLAGPGGDLCSPASTRSLPPRAPRSGTRPRQCALHWPVDRYFTEGRRTARFLGCDVVKYHHTPTTYVRPCWRPGLSSRPWWSPSPIPG